MPVGPGRFRVKTEPSGAKIRLHFTPSGTVNEAKNLGTGATHTASEFRRDKKRKASRGRKRG